jgi:hypothetical protein
MGIKQKADDARKKAYQKVIATKLLDGIDQFLLLINFYLLKTRIKIDTLQ